MQSSGLTTSAYSFNNPTCSLIIPNARSILNLSFIISLLYSFLDMKTLQTHINWDEIERQLKHIQSVEGGFSRAHRGILNLDNEREIFVKMGTEETSKKWAKKEIAVYRFLQKHNYPHSPHLLSTNDAEDAFAIEAYTPSNGWDWNKNWSESRIEITIQAINDLATIKLDETERNLFSENNLSQKDNGWQQLVDYPKRQEHLFLKLKASGQENIIPQLDFLKSANISTKYHFKDDKLVHYDIRADNCAWNNNQHEVKIVDWNWAQLGDQDIDYAGLFTSIQASGFSLPKEILNQVNPAAFHWLAGFWFNSASQPIWENGPEDLRSFQLESGLTALKLSSYL